MTDKFRGKNRFRAMFDDDNFYCQCKCHVDGEQVKHVTGCCEISGAKYIESNGKRDPHRYEAAWKAWNERPKKSFSKRIEALKKGRLPK